MAEYLPTVSTRLTADIGEFTAEIAAAKKVWDSLNGDINIDANIDKALAKIETVKKALDGIKSPKPIIATADTADAVKNLGDLRTALAEVNSLVTGFTRRMGTNTTRAAAWATGIDLTRKAVDDLRTAFLDLAAAAQAAGQSQVLASMAAAAAYKAQADVLTLQLAKMKAATGGRGFNPNFFGIPLNATTLHWIISGGSEILAVTIPAMIGLAAASAAAAEGVGWVTEHMKANYTAVEATSSMYHQTMGSVLGLKSQLQAAQTAADPMVFSILGSALLVAKNDAHDLAAEGTNLVGVFQTFSAKVAAEFHNGGPLKQGLDAFTNSMVSDATKWGQFFGNFGDSLSVVAANMPGIAELLLSMLTDIMDLVTWVVHLTSSFQVFGASLITIFMAYEEFNRWGGLVVTLLVRMGVATRAAGMDSMVLTWSHFIGVLQSIWSILPGVVSLLGRAATAMRLAGAGSALGNASTGLTGLISKLATTAGGLPLVGITLAAVAVGVLIDKLITATTAAQRLKQAMQDAVNSSSNVNAVKTITANMAVLQASIAGNVQSEQQLQAAYDNAAPGMNRLALLKQLRRETVQGTADNATYNAALKQQQSDLNNVNQGAQWVAQTFGTSLAGALILADNANVKLSAGILGTGRNMTTAQMQIESLVLGYRAMGQASGEVGADMTALAIQSGLQATQVDKLNSAWDSYMSIMTGGTTGLGGFVQSLKNLGSVVASNTKNLGAAASINLNPSQFADALKSFSDVGSQAWQNWGQILSTAQQQVDWFRTAGSLGAIGAGQFSQAVLGMVSSLTQFAAKSPAAQQQLLLLAQQANPNIKTWAQLNAAIKQGKDNLNQTAKATEQVTQKLGDMAQIAQNLGNVLNANLLSTMSQATINASGLSKAVDAYDKTMWNSASTSKQQAAATQNVIRALELLGYSAQHAQQFVQALQSQIDAMHGKTVTVTTLYQSSGYAPGGTKRNGSGFASGTSGAPAGWAWVGEAGPELVKFRGGETVLPHHVSMGFAAGTGDAENHIHVYLDGREIYREVQSRALGRQRRTGSNGLSKRTR